jgi:hypothetical protein
MLTENQAQRADNVKLYSKELRYWQGSTDEYTPTITGVHTIYKYYNASTALWLTWTGDVNVALSPMTDTSDYRYYYTGDGVPKKSNYTLTSTGTGAYPRGWLNLGVPAPTAAATVSGGAAYRTVTITIAAPGVVTLAAHGFQIGNSVKFATTGALPTGLVAGTVYYIVSITTDTFQVSTTAGGTAITTTGTQSGTQSVASIGNPESRSYIYTHISTFGSVTEESAPSPASTIVTVYDGSPVTVNGFATAPTTNYNITHRRIYRLVTGATTDTYQFVAEIPVATTSYSDTLTVAELGEVIGTLGWDVPPSGLKGIGTHPSGSLVGFQDNTIYFSEPYYPHAWPTAYALNVPSKIVGLGIFGTSIVVMTERYPFIVSGSYPGVMSVERVPILEPCVSKQSIASDEFGVVYASPNGMVGIGPSMRGVITSNLFAYNEWKEYHPDLVSGVTTNNQYFAIYPNNIYQMRTMVINRADIPALSFTSMQADAVHVDSQTGHLYYLDPLDNIIKHWDNDPLNPYTYNWKSKRFVMPQAVTFSALKLDAEYDQIGDSALYNQVTAEQIAYNQSIFDTNLLAALNTGAVNTMAVNNSTMLNLPSLGSLRSVQVIVYGDGEQQVAIDMTSFDPVRIPAFKSRSIEVEIVGTVYVRSISLATTVAELHQ